MQKLCKNVSQLGDSNRGGWIAEFWQRIWSSGLFGAVRAAGKKIPTATFLGDFFQLFVGNFLKFCILGSVLKSCIIYKGKKNVLKILKL